ncbi:MAG: hypothetical protein EOP83_22515 [Verrucomicrobiaceae bacterium]|nr:MAG: hypothetical protein EOP83_22515 [Verrucomicrobiaceae bacterium]
MEAKDYLPIAGVAVGWLLNEAGAAFKRSAERRRALGRAVSLMYFLCMEMILLKIAQEKYKDMTQDVVEWERMRQRSFKIYTANDPEFVKRMDASLSEVAEFYPVEAHELRQIVSKYEFFKTRTLDAFTKVPSAYIEVLSQVEAAYMGYQHRLEKLLGFLALRHSALNYFRIRKHFKKIRRGIPDRDMVFIEQAWARRKAKDRAPPKGESPAPEPEPTTPTTSNESPLRQDA